MKKFISTDRIKISYICNIVLVLLMTLLVIFLRPSNNTFQYQYDLGKPWQYDKLKADYEFPILKNKDVIKSERDSIRDHTIPIFYIDKDAIIKVNNKLHDIYNNINDSDIKTYHNLYNDLSTKLKDIYNRGLISLENLDYVKKKGMLEVNMHSDNKALYMQPLTRFYTLKEAYDIIYDNLKKIYNKDNIDKFNIGNLLRVNVHLDTLLTDRLIHQAEQKLSINNGIIQKDEVIVDNGQIVDNHIYDILNSLKISEQNKRGTVTQMISYDLGLSLILIIILSLMSIYLTLFCDNFFGSYKNQIFIFLFLMMMVSITELNVKFEWFSEYAIPFVMIPIMIRIFFDSRIALINYLFVISISSIFVPNPLDFMLIEIMAGITALLTLQNLNNRAQIIKCTFFVYIVYIFTYLGLILYHQGKVTNHDLPILFIFAVNFIFLMFTYLMVYIIERIFGYVSNITLVELSDMNNPLLSQLSEVAPGTFQHSLQVSILATEATRRVGGDVVLIRAGALYHDIGKMKNPLYFTENQGVYNPHSNLDYKESARIIIKHVTDGVVMAHKYNLPPQIIDFIRTHHGRSTTRYFYNSYCNEHVGEAVDPEPFTYPGPNPFSKETGILMLADAVEASSRSLKEHTETGIEELINRIIDGIVAEGLLNDTPITFKDIKTIKQVFCEKIKIMYHSRITYPEKITKQ